MALEIITQKTPLPPRIFIYGPAGIGKTTLAASAPGVLLIPAEDGSDNLAVPRTKTPKTWEELNEIINDVYTSHLPYTTLAIDSVTACESLAGGFVCKYNGQKSVASIPYKGREEVAAELRKFLDKLNLIRFEKRMAIILTGHMTTIRYEDPRSQGYDRFSPRMHKDILPMFVEWGDAVLCANYRVYTTEAGGKAKASGEGERLFFCTERPTHVAKNRYSLPDELPMSWAGVFAGISKSFQPTAEKSAQTATQAVAESEKQ